MPDTVTSSSVSPETLAPLLRTRRFGRALRWHDTIGSTNAEALRWTAEGAPEGALVGTDHQMAGRGRHRRVWTDTPGQSLLLSLVLRPTLPTDRLGLLPLAAGLALAEAIAPHGAPTAPRLKWPNDVLLDGKKVCGVLLEGHLGSSTPPALVLGIGLNVNATDFPAQVAPRATSLALETGRLVPRLPLLADLLLALETHYDRLHREGSDWLCARFEQRMVGLGESIVVAFPSTDRPALSGTLLGIAPDGSLRLGTAGDERRFHAGEITLQRP